MKTKWGTSGIAGTLGKIKITVKSGYNFYDLLRKETMTSKNKNIKYRSFNTFDSLKSVRKIAKQLESYRKVINPVNNRLINVNQQVYESFRQHQKNHKYYKSVSKNQNAKYS